MFALIAVTIFFTRQTGTDYLYYYLPAADYLVGSGIPARISPSIVDAPFAYPRVEYLLLALTSVFGDYRIYAIKLAHCLKVAVLFWLVCEARVIASAGGFPAGRAHRAVGRRLREHLQHRLQCGPRRARAAPAVPRRSAPAGAVAARRLRGGEQVHVLDPAAAVLRRAVARAQARPLRAGPGAARRGTPRDQLPLYGNPVYPIGAHLPEEYGAHVKAVHQSDGRATAAATTGSSASGPGSPRPVRSCSPRRACRACSRPRSLSMSSRGWSRCRRRRRATRVVTSCP